MYVIDPGRRHHQRGKQEEVAPDRPDGAEEEPEQPGSMSRMALVSGDISLILPIRIIPSQFSISLLTRTGSESRFGTAEGDLAIAEQDATRYPFASRSGHRVGVDHQDQRLRMVRHGVSPFAGRRALPGVSTSP